MLLQISSAFFSLIPHARPVLATRAGCGHDKTARLSLPGLRHVKFSETASQFEVDPGRVEGW